jgi:PKD repeat protein
VRSRPSLVAIVALLLVLASLVWTAGRSSGPRAAYEAAPFSATIELSDDWGVAPFAVAFRPVVQGGALRPPYAYTWLFGDGSPPTTEQAPLHVYRDPGRYWATLRVRDSRGTTTSYMAEVWVDEGAEATPPAGQAFSATIALDTDWGEAPLTVKLTGAAEGPGAKPPLAYSWEFGDGSPPSTEPAPTHVYQAVGDYRVMLTIRAAGGAVARDYALIWVEGWPTEP